MQLQDIPKKIEETLELNGLLHGVEIGGRPNVVRDMRTICQILLKMFEWMNGTFKSDSAKISQMKKRITELEHEVEAIKHPYPYEDKKPPQGMVIDNTDDTQKYHVSDTMGGS